MSHTRAWRDGEIVGDGFALEQVSDYLEKGDCFVWVDFESPTQNDLQRVGDELNLHELAIEDALVPGQRPKIDRYDGFLFATVYDAVFTTESGELVTSEVKAFITKHALVTIHDASFDIGVVRKHWDDNKDLVSHGVAYLLWGLLDSIVDRQYICADALDDQIDGLEDGMFETKPQTMDVQRRSFTLRRSLVLLRRVVTPMREVLNTMLRSDDMNTTDGMRPYYQDVYDHVLRVTEQTDSLRDLVSTILDTNLSIQSNRMNLVMKKVTSWAAIIAVPTAVTGFFGQNIPFPGYGSVPGFVVSSAAIVVIGIALYLSFKKWDWL